MACCIYIDNPDHERKTIADDLELVKLLDEVNAGNGERQLLIEKKTFRYRRWFRERVRYEYALYWQVVAPEYQMINFGPKYEPWPEDKISWGFFVSRQAVAGFLFGVLFARREIAT